MEKNENRKSKKLITIGLVAISLYFLFSAQSKGGQERPKSQVGTQVSSTSPTPNPNSKTTSKLPEYTTTSEHALKDCSQWGNIVITGEYTKEQLISLGKKLVESTVFQSYYLFDDNNPAMLKKHADFEIYNSSDSCTNGTKVCEQDNDLYEWSKQHLLGIVRWTYARDDKGELIGSGGFWGLERYDNDKYLETMRLEDNTPSPLSYKKLGTHTSNGKNWQDLMICDASYSIDGDNLLSFAKKLHKVNPDNYYQLFGDDKRYAEFVKSDENYPNFPWSKAMEDWMHENDYGMINKTSLGNGNPIKWYLWLTLQSIDGLTDLNEL